MINIRTINKLKNGDGLTLKNGKIITYKTGWQVATTGIICTTAREAMNSVKNYGGNCGIWIDNNLYYIDKSHRVNTKHEAIDIGRKHNQISVYGWKTGKCVEC